MTTTKPGRIAETGFAVRSQLVHLGHAARLLARLALTGGQALRRFGLVRDQILFLGNFYQPFCYYKCRIVYFLLLGWGDCIA